jgi:hypothetical protein
MFTVLTIFRSLAVQCTVVRVGWAECGGLTKSRESQKFFLINQKLPDFVQFSKTDPKSAHPSVSVLSFTTMMPFRTEVI